MRTQFKHYLLPYLSLPNAGSVFVQADPFFEATHMLFLYYYDAFSTTLAPPYKSFPRNTRCIAKLSRTRILRRRETPSSHPRTSMRSTAVSEIWTLRLTWTSGTKEEEACVYMVLLLLPDFRHESLGRQLSCMWYASLPLLPSRKEDCSRIDSMKATLEE